MKARLRVQLDYQWSEPPDEHMQQLLESFDTLKRHFGDEAHAAKIIERETRLANEWIAENAPEEPDSKPRTREKSKHPTSRTARHPSISSTTWMPERYGDLNNMNNRGRSHFCHLPITRWETSGALRDGFRVW